jgi:hypothetical protein
MLVRCGAEIATRREVDTRWRCWGRLILGVFLDVLAVDLRMTATNSLTLTLLMSPRCWIQQLRFDQFFKSNVGWK